MAVESIAFDVQHRHQREAIGFDVGPGDTPKMTGFGCGAVQLRMGVVISADEHTRTLAVAIVSRISGIV